jgi:hypothetical protein
MVKEGKVGVRGRNGKKSTEDKLCYPFCYYNNSLSSEGGGVVGVNEAMVDLARKAADGTRTKEDIECLLGISIGKGGRRGDIAKGRNRSDATSEGSRDEIEERKGGEDVKRLVEYKGQAKYVEIWI